MQRIFAILIVVAAVAGGILWYVHWSQTRALNSGDVYVRDQPGDNAKPATPESATPEPAAPEPTAAQPTASTPAPAVAAQPPKPSLAQPAATRPAASQPATAPPAQPIPPQEIASSGPEPSGVAPSRIGPTRRPTAIPASDTIRRNPPNGQLFAGSGRFQLYRQGDITWRVDTQTGHACILFATDAQWSQARVFDHGCGPS
jgi:hypothetical protein